MADIIYPLILEREYPGAWTMVGPPTSYSAIVWEDSERAKPTKKSLDALWVSTYAAVWDSLQVMVARKSEYSQRSVGDQLDAVVKAFDQLRADGVTLPVETNELVDWSLAIKAKYPKASDA